MSDSIPDPVLRAAEVRAHGGSWEQAAKESKWSLVGLKVWIRNHESDWARALGRARREAREAACDEAVAILRKQLRTDETKAILGAASTLTARFVKRIGNKPAGSRPDPSIVTPFWTEEELQEMDAEYEAEQQALATTQDNGGGSPG